MLSDPRTTPATRWAGDRGSALMMMPAAVLILIILGAIAADFSHAHSAQRDLIAIADSVANDAVTYGVDPTALRQGTGEAYPIDDARVDQVVRQSLSAHRSLDRNLEARFDIDKEPVQPTAGNGQTRMRITITLYSRVDYIFAKAVPGGPDNRKLQASGTAVAVEE